MAAVHAGQISDAGGFVLIQMDPALQGKFVGSIRNGIESKNGPKSPRSISFPGGGDHSGVASTQTGTEKLTDKTLTKDKAMGLLKKSAKGLASDLNP